MHPAHVPLQAEPEAAGEHRPAHTRISGRLLGDRHDAGELAVQLDVHVLEELDRLDTHLSEIRSTLNRKEPIGRRLDFLMQELNREANTLASKSIAIDTTQSAVELKVLIEQMREQIQNIE